MRHKIRHARAKEEYEAPNVRAANQHAGSSGEYSDVKIPASFAEESSLVRALIDYESDPSSPISRASMNAFAPVHTRLMDAIEADAGRNLCTESTLRQSAFARTLDMFRHRMAASAYALSKVTRSTAARYALTLFLIGAVGLSGHHVGKLQGARALPIQSFVDDFDASLKSSMPLDYVSPDATDAKATAHWLSHQVGHRVLLPTPTKTGTRILGARRHELWGRAVAQAHYMKNGVRIALYQIRAPRAGLNDLQEAEYKGRTYLAARRGNYHVVVWRKGDDIVTMISPLERNASLRLAAAMRDASPDV